MGREVAGWLNVKRNASYNNMIPRKNSAGECHQATGEIIRDEDNGAQNGKGEPSGDRQDTASGHCLGPSCRAGGPYNVVA